MTVDHPQPGAWDWSRIQAVAIGAILVFGLLGGLLHHHDSAAESDACAFCHAGAQTPGPDLAGALVATTFAVVGFTPPVAPSRLPGVVDFSTLIPRAPPAATHPAVSWEGLCGPVRVSVPSSLLNM